MKKDQGECQLKLQQVLKKKLPPATNAIEYIFKSTTTHQLHTKIIHYESPSASGVGNPDVAHVVKRSIVRKRSIGSVLDPLILVHQ